MKQWQEKCVTKNKLNTGFKFTNHDMNIINLKTLEKT